MVMGKENNFRNQSYLAWRREDLNATKTMEEAYVDEKFNLFYVVLKSKNRIDEKTIKTKQ